MGRFYLPPKTASLVKIKLVTRTTVSFTVKGILRRDMEVEPACNGLPAVSALSGSPPGGIAVEKVDLPGEETVAAWLNRIPKVHVGLFLSGFFASIRRGSSGRPTCCPSPFPTTAEPGSTIRLTRSPSGTSTITVTWCASSHWTEEEKRGQSSLSPLFFLMIILSGTAGGLPHEVLCRWRAPLETVPGHAPFPSGSASPDGSGPFGSVCGSSA